MHSTFCGAHGLNKRATTLSTTGVSGGSIKPSLQMDLDCIAIDKNGNAVGSVRLENVALLKNSNYNLFSLSKLLNSGWKMQGDATKVVMSKGSMILIFDIVIKTTKGALFCARLKRKEVAVAGANAELTKSMSIDKAHRLLGHADEETTRAMASALGWHIRIGKMKPCEDCAIAKAKQKNVNKDASAKKAERPNERWSHDIATIKPPKRSGLTMRRPNWHILVDEFTGMKFSAFYPRKNDIVEPMCERLQHATGRGAPVKYLRQDNAGENLKIQARCKSADWKLPVEIEYTAKDTPQQNSRAETSFTTMAARARAMMTGANVPMVERYRLFQEAANHATKLDWLAVVKIGGVKKTRLEHYGMEIPAWSKNLKTWGEAGTVKTGKDGKLGDRGVTMIFVGFANKHGPDVYRMLNPHTRRTTNNRDVIWLNRMFYETPCVATTKMLPEIAIPINSYHPIRSVGQNPKKNKIKKPVDLTSAYLAF